MAPIHTLARFQQAFKLTLPYYLGLLAIGMVASLIRATDETMLIADFEAVFLDVTIFGLLWLAWEYWTHPEQEEV